MIRRNKDSGPTQVQLEDGGWFDLAASSEIYAWKSFPQGVMTNYRLLRTRNGSIILEYPAPSFVWGGIRTSASKLYRTLTAEQACLFLIQNNAPQPAARLFPAQHAKISASHHAAER